MVPNRSDELEAECALLFELSSSDRVAILTELRQTSLKMRQVADKLEMTVTETFRHLQRLSDAKLVEKNVDGTYGVTRYGLLVLDLMPSLHFVSKNNAYFLDHDLSQLPPEYVKRIGELAAGTLVADVVTVINRFEKMISEFDEFLWVMSTQVILSNVPVVAARLARGGKFRFLFPESLLSITKKVPGVDQNIERRCLPKVPAVAGLSEKEALVLLPQASGEHDLTGFFSTDTAFRKWVHDLFLHFWEEGKPWYEGMRSL